MRRSSELFGLAQQIADESPNFFRRKGPGVGNRDTNVFMDKLKEAAERLFGQEFAEQAICGNNTGYKVDFYFCEEATIVEVALSLHNPVSEFEKDVIKAILGKKSGNIVKKLIFISKPKLPNRQDEPGPRSIISWAKADYGIEVVICDLKNNHVD